MTRLWAQVVGLLVVVAMAGPAAASLEAALTSVARDQWSEAARQARAQGGTAVPIVEWHRLRDRDSGADFDDYRAFLRDYGDWPGLPWLRARGEAVMDARTPRAHVLEYFRTDDPQTANGSYWLALALLADGRSQAAHDTLIRAWTTMSFDSEEEALYLGRFRDLLAPHHEARLDDALWRGAYREAGRMQPLVGQGWQALARARQGLRQDQPGVDGLISAVPESLRDHPGLAFERMAWRMRKGRIMPAAELMQAQSISSKGLGRPEEWSDRRRRIARQLMRDKNYREAYLIASSHKMTAGSNFADLEWLSGYIALRFLDAPAAALDHFKRFQGAVASPISLGRAGYWQGRAYEAMGEAEQARAAYGFGAEYQTSFYGQLAAERAGIAPDPLLAGGERFPDGATAGFRGSSVYQAGVSLHQARSWALSARFFAHLAESLGRDQIGSMAARIEVLRNPYLRLAVAKRAASMGLTLHKAYYPLMSISTRATPDVEPELALAIARRESEFNHTVVSHAGARGLMQLMPGTAKLMAPKVGVPYDLGRLTRDPSYNAALGTGYLQRLRSQFGGSTVLVAAGYNAGPGNPRKWVARYGDPRSGSVDVVDWIEHIPFRETRNYVMRVMESLAPYRARLAGQTGSLGLEDALKAR